MIQRKKERKKERKKQHRAGCSRWKKTIIDTNMMVLCGITRCRIYDTVRAKYNIVGKEGRAC